MMKKRAANFTPEEKNVLLESVLRHQDVLFGRVGLPSRYWAAKKAAWCNIVDSVNKVRPSPGRNVHECRRKLKDLKAATRKKFMDVNGVWKQDIDIKEATAEELKILKLLGSEENPEDENQIDVSIVKIENNVPEIVFAADEPTNPDNAKVVVEPQTIFCPIPSAVPQNTLPSMTSTIPVISQATTLKVEPMKRPVVQVLPLTLGDGQGHAQSQGSGAQNLTASQSHIQCINLAQDRDEGQKINQKHHFQSQTISTQGPNLSTTATASFTTMSATNPNRSSAAPSQSQSLALGQSQLPGPVNVQGQIHGSIAKDSRRKTAKIHGGGRNHHGHGSQDSYHGGARPFAEFATPVPMKRIKLFVRNVPALSQPNTSVGPTASGNVLNFAICSCTKHAGNNRSAHDVGVQTDERDPKMSLIEKIVETQRMTARALTNLEKIAQGARELGMINMVNNNNKVAGERKNKVTFNLEMGKGEERNEEFGLKREPDEYTNTENMEEDNNVEINIKTETRDMDEKVKNIKIEVVDNDKENTLPVV